MSFDRINEEDEKNALKLDGDDLMVMLTDPNFTGMTVDERMDFEETENAYYEACEEEVEAPHTEHQQPSRISPWSFHQFSETVDTMDESR